MKQSLIRFSLLCSAALALTVAPLCAFAQNTNKPAADKKVSAQSADTTGEKAAKGGPFHGKLAALDKVAKTITVGKRTFQISSETKIKKSGKPATLEDGVVGETVSGYVKPAADGKLVASTVNFGPKVPGDTGEKAKTAADKENQAKYRPRGTS